MRNGFKSDKSPWGDKGDPHDLPENTGVREESRAHRHSGAAVSKHRSGEAHSNSDGEKHHHHCHDPGSTFFAFNAQQTDKPHHRQSHQDFCKIDIIAQKCVEIPLFEYRLQKIPRKQGNTCGISPEYRNVDQEHEPGDQEGTVIAKDVLYIGVQTSCPRITVSQKMIVI